MDSSIASLDVRASLTFIARDPKFASEKPYELGYISPDGLPLRNFELDKVDVTVHDLRPIKDSVLLDREGIAVVELRSKMAYEDYFDESKVKAVFAEEVRERLLSHLRARRLFFHECVVGPAPSCLTRVNI